MIQEAFPRRWQVYILDSGRKLKKTSVQTQRARGNGAAGDSLESEASILFLASCSAFFALETLFHYENFLHESSLRTIAPEALDLIIGSAIITVVYLWLAISCIRNRTEAEPYLAAMCFASVLVLAYFAVEVAASAFPNLYYAADLNFGQFVSGYGSVTILTEILAMFFTYRVATSASTQTNTQRA